MSNIPTSKNGNISIEHVPTGSGLPDWLIENLLALFGSAEESPPRLMVIHSGEASRRQSIEIISEKVKFGIDPTLFQTIDSLIDSLHVDLHLPKVLENDGVTNLLVHLSCEESAEEFGFPIIHPVPSKTWHYSKTSRLMQLHSTLAEEDPNFVWENDPGVAEFDRVLKSIETKLDCVHPARKLSKVVSTLQQWYESGDVPFSLSSIDGIVLLNHEPSLSWLRRELLIAISKFVPIHQLCHAGKFRLGEHGAWLCDIPDVSREEGMLDGIFSSYRKPWRAPELIPWDMHQVGFGKSSVHRITLGRAEHDFDAALSLINEFEGKGSVLVADAALTRRRNQWAEALQESAYKVANGPVSLRTNPAIHWVLALAKIAHGEDAWSMQSIRSLAVQNTLPFVENWLSGGQHPNDPTIKPKGHSRILEDVARSFHILGGPGALSKWLRALENWRPDPLIMGYEKIMHALEETQWWMRNLVQFLRPLLSDLDVAKVEEIGEITGAHSHEKLPLIDSACDGNEWLQSLLRAIDWDIIAGRSDSTITGIKQLIELSNRCSVILDAGGHTRADSGLEWVEELEMIISDSSIYSKQNWSGIELLTPADSLGCKADLVLVCGLSSKDWSMRSPTVPWLDSETMLELGILKPDAPLCDARHYLRHLLNSGNTVILLDPSNDADSQPCAPLSEWLTNLTNEEKKSLSLPPQFLNKECWNCEDPARSWEFVYDEKFENEYLSPRLSSVITTKEGVRSDVNGPRIRHVWQNSGLAMKESRDSEVGALYPEATVVGWAEQIMRDRYSREPEKPDVDDLWVSSNCHERLVSMERQKIDPGKGWPKNRTKLRQATEWPLLTGRTGPRTIIPAIDPRPLRPTNVGNATYDSMNGNDKSLEIQDIVWSPSRLKSWLDCPRKGWLEKHLRASSDEDMREDLDARTRGTMYHDSIAKLMCENLGFEMGTVRLDYGKANLANCGEEHGSLMADLLGIVIESAPWLMRGDAVAAQRRRELLAMEINDVESFLSEPSQLALDGSIGRLLKAELELSSPCVIALEAPLEQDDEEFVNISIPQSPELSSNSQNLGSLKVRGRIDRVEVLWNLDSNNWEYGEGEKGLCPLDMDIGEEWKAKRYVVIRDLKTVKGPTSGDMGKRHRSALFDEVQLALYARAWEIMNPGDRVVGVGITEAGETVEHYVEMDATVIDEIDCENIGTITNFSERLFRRPGENSNPKSNPFRAWLRQRLSVAVLASEAAINGEVRPTPSKESCGYCNVRTICGLGHIFGGGK